MFIAVSLVALVNINIVLKLLVELGMGVIVYAAVVLLLKNETCYLLLDKILGFLKAFAKKGR